MTSLYELDQYYKKLLFKEELTDDDLAEIEHAAGLIEDKIISYACVIEELKAKRSMTENAIDMANEKLDRISTNIDKLEKRITEVLINNGISKIDKHPLFDVKIKQNRASVDVQNQDEIPVEYWKTNQVRVLDKTKIREDIENLGLVIPGVKLTKKMVLKIG